MGEQQDLENKQDREYDRAYALIMKTLDTSLGYRLVWALDRLGWRIATQVTVPAPSECLHTREERHEQKSAHGRDDLRRRGYLHRRQRREGRDARAPRHSAGQHVGLAWAGMDRAR